MENISRESVMVTRRKAKTQLDMESQKIVISTRSRLRKRHHVENDLEQPRPKRRTRTRLKDRQQSDEDREGSDSDTMLSDSNLVQDGMQCTLVDTVRDDKARDVQKTTAIDEEPCHDKQDVHNGREGQQIAGGSTLDGSRDESRQSDETLDMEPGNWCELDDIEFGEKSVVEDAVELKDDEVVSVDVSALDALLKSLPGRKHEIQLLLSLFGESEQRTVPAVFISGPPASGKTTVVRSVVQYLQAPHAFLDCLECHSTSLLFESVLNQLSGTVPSSANRYSSYSLCSNPSDFVRLLKRVIRDSGNGGQTTFVVVDQAERLRSLESSVLMTLLRLNELTGTNVCLILISRVSWETFYCDTGFPHPVTLYFPNYSLDDVSSILLLDAPSQSLRLFNTFVQLLCRVFRVACSDLNEWRRLARVLYPKFIEPVLDGKVREKDTKRLWTHIEPHFRSTMNHVLLTRIDANSGDDTLSFDLPYNSKFLLIAAYLASYNPVNTDKRFFSKKGEKLSKRQKRSEKAAKSKMTTQLTGPQLFPLTRLLAIFCSIVKKQSQPRADLLQQISTLVSSGLLQQLQSHDLLQKPRLKCAVSLETIQVVARTVHFDVTKYLYDFR